MNVMNGEIDAPMCAITLLDRIHVAAIVAIVLTVMDTHAMVVVQCHEVDQFFIPYVWFLFKILMNVLRTVMDVHRYALTQ